MLPGLTGSRLSNLSQLKLHQFQFKHIQWILNLHSGVVMVYTRISMTNLEYEITKSHSDNN